MPDQYLDFTQTSPSLVSLPSYFTNGLPVEYAHNIMYDESGSVLFFVVGQILSGVVTATIYDGQGNVIHQEQFGNQGTESVPNFVEIPIIPVPGDCNSRFFIVLGEVYLGIDTKTSPYTIYIPPTALSIEIDAEKCDYLNYAVTPPNEAGENFMYVSTCVFVNKFIITQDGISFDDSWFFPLLAGTAEVGLRGEAEVIKIPNPTPNKTYRLAIPHTIKGLVVGQPSFWRSAIAVYYMDENGNRSTGEVPKVLDLGPYPYFLNVAPDNFQKGMEFSPNGEYLYFTTILPPYINLIKIDDQTNTPVLGLTNAIDFKDGFIEVGRDGKLYFAADDRLGSISDPNVPTSTWDDAAITGLNIPKTYGNLFFSGNPIHSDFGARLLPDQIDGYDYDGNRPFHVNTFTVSTSGNWTPQNNPFDNSAVVVIHDQLTFDPDVVVTIEGMIFRFDDDANVILERGGSGLDGAEVTLDNTVFGSYDDCGTQSVMWKGINVHGNNLASQYAAPDRIQGKLILKNNSIIEDAVTAVNTFNTGTGDVVGYTGAIIQATNSTFRNNSQAVLMYQYENFLPINGQALTDLSFFKNCTFETTRELNDPSLFPLQFAGLIGVNGISFLGCTFQNTTPLTFDAMTASNRGKGIESIGSGIYVKGLCQDGLLGTFPCQNVKGNTFSGLDCGIQSSAYGNFQNWVVDHANFIDNKSGIRLNGINYATITSSTFTVAPYGLYNPYDPSELPYGLYLNGCTGYKVEANKFNSSDPDAQIMLGTVVFNSGNLPNVLYKNEYENLYVNVLAEGDNRGPNAEDGLQIKCNEFTNLRGLGLGSVEGWDIAVTKLGIGSTAEGIAEFQGTCDNMDPSAPAGNRFYFSNCTVNEDANIFVNTGPSLSIGGIIYSHDVDNIAYPQSPLCYTQNNLLVLLNSCTSSFNETTSCPSSFRVRPDLEEVQLNPGCVFVNGTWLCGKNILDYAEGVTTDLIALMDGGDTHALLNKIAQSGAPGNLKITLLAASPYLSEKVLIATINAGLPPGILKDVLLANSPLSDQVLDALAHISIPNGIANQIKAVQGGVAVTTKLESQIAYSKTQRELGVNELIRSYLKNDNLTEARKNVLTLLEEESARKPKEDRRHEEVAANIELEELNNAEAVMNSIHAGPPDNACKLLQLEIDLKRANKHIKDMTKSQESMVRQIASEIELKSGAKAQSMLKAAYSEETKETIILPVKNQLKMAPIEEGTQQLPIAKNLRIFPNPFRDFATIEAVVPDKFAVGRLRIVDLLGVTHKVIGLRAGYNDVTLLKDDLPASGIYFCILEVNDQVLEKTKFISLR